MNELELGIFNPAFVPVRSRPKFREPNRRTGRTTRLVNDAVDRFYKNGKTALCDHYCENGHTWTHAGSKYILNAFLDRLQFTHGIHLQQITTRYIKDGTWCIEFKPGNYYFHN